MGFYKAFRLKVRRMWVFKEIKTAGHRSERSATRLLTSMRDRDHNADPDDLPIEWQIKS